MNLTNKNSAGGQPLFGTTMTAASDASAMVRNLVVGHHMWVDIGRKQHWQNHHRPALTLQWKRSVAPSTQWRLLGPNSLTLPPNTTSTTTSLFGCNLPTINHNNLFCNQATLLHASGTTPSCRKESLKWLKLGTPKTRSRT